MTLKSKKIIKLINELAEVLSKAKTDDEVEVEVSVSITEIEELLNGFKELRN